MPESFVEFSIANPEILIELRYHSTYNFIGDTIQGYSSDKVFLTKEAADALSKAQVKFNSLGFRLKIFDAFRPQRAVNHFVRWARDLTDTTMKSVFYPKVDKSKLFDLGYIARKSGHTRGSTIDLTLVDKLSGKELDMGSYFDLFDPISHHNSNLITNKQTENRQLLKQTMANCGFKSYSQEWWHYTLADEPFPDTYFDFEIK
ncbi:MAG: M15 family metallopeptidase [Cyclobacteriaceae bacterium]|nr:M15 family metallopeptidase [Cyclobacteriaceae bacterium]